MTYGVIFCHGIAENPREQRIMPAQVTAYNFQLDEYENYRFIRLTILADGLTSQGKRALAQSSDMKGRQTAEKIIAILQEC